MSSAATLIQALRDRKLTLGFAESCTGGLLSATVTKLAGVSDVFMGSVVSYSNQVKMDFLKVSADSLRGHGAVSEVVAREMARGACLELKVACAVAVTGIAGPSGGTPQKPVGTVWFAVKGPGFEETRQQLFKGDRESIQRQSVDFALEFLTQELLGK